MTDPREESPATVGSPRAEGLIGFRPLRPADFGVLARWLAQPHVHRWWHHEFSAEAVERDFGPVARGEEPAEDLLVLLDGTPVGLVQRCRWHDYPDYVTEVAPILTVPPGAVTIDYLIGPPDLAGRGLGPRVIAAVVADTWSAYPDATTIVVPTSAGNRASWRALEKAGFTYVASGDLTPDNPIDPPLCHVYRLDRPD